MKHVTIALDDETYRSIERRAAVVRHSIEAEIADILRETGDTPERKGAVSREEFDRLERMQDELFAKLDREGRGFDFADRLTRDELYDRDRAREGIRDAYR